ncbi:hypothetical protein [Anaerosporobacter sp.]|uniref:hypothetical protein n=1 Tax=Anaerosporobacter sp. TaxID=1872529 RepID=UPI00286F18CC|nr:hypothetical protein [Anaerosporobacter sp.]
MNSINQEIPYLYESLKNQKKIFQDTLILNPVENIPPDDILMPCNSFLHGLYNTDSIRDTDSKFQSKLQFSGRDSINKDINNIYELWADLLGAEKLSMRLLSGLHAHIVLFMSITNIGDKVMLLPEKAGGHLSGKAILQRLGLQIEEIPFDTENRCIDKEKCQQMIDCYQPKILFIDRSEGIDYEDFSWLNECTSCYKIFDASQYLTNIICGDYKNPFDMGFDLILSSMHKNLPGPQRAFVCTKVKNEYWEKLRSGISTYVSNMHVFSIYSAGLLLGHLDELHNLSQNMLKNALALDYELMVNDVPIVSRNTKLSEPPTHHCWIKPPCKEKTFDLFLILERLGILTNYRLLPYNIGYGLRLGMSAATISGLTKQDIPLLGALIGKAYHEGYSDKLKINTVDFIHKIKGDEHKK